MVPVLLAAAVLALLHVVGGRLRFIRYLPRSRWLSFAGGVSVAYVFLHLLPEIAEAEEALGKAAGSLDFEGRAPYVIALIGLALFYALETVTRSSPDDERTAGNVVFWFSIATYAVYNSLLGYLLHARYEEGASELVIFVVAIGLHFLVNDFALREHHKDVYTSTGRWLLVGAILLGATAGLIVDVSLATRGSVLAFIGGGVILNVLKEELPEERESSFGSFAAGVVLYGALLLAL